MPPKKSMLWNFFKQTSKDYVICNLCQQQLKYFVSTTNLKQHLIRKRPLQYNQHVQNPTDSDLNDPVPGTSLPITFVVNETKRTADTLHCCTAWRWNENRREEIAANLQSTLISWRGLAVEELMGLIAQVCDRSLKRPRTQQGRRAVYWWTQEVAKHRRELQRARCDLQRANRRNRFHEQLTDRLIAEFKEAKVALRKEIRKSLGSLY
jgi:hypothetical protein